MGIKAFFKKAFGDMKDSAKAQHEVDRSHGCDLRLYR